jgi:hypothetical protein
MLHDAVTTQARDPTVATSRQFILMTAENRVVADSSWLGADLESREHKPNPNHRAPGRTHIHAEHDTCRDGYCLLVSSCSRRSLVSMPWVGCSIFGSHSDD